MAGISEEYINSIMEKVTSIHSIQNWRYTKEKFESVGQNYFGIIVPVVLFGECNGQDVRMELVFKLAPTDERYRISGAVTVMFSREIYVYNIVLKNYQEIQKHFPEHLQYIVPQCYYIQKEFCNEAIVMQNMLEEGFRPFTHEIFLDLDHIIISLKSLAKLHGLSFILESKNPDLYNEISETCTPLTEKSAKRYLEVMSDRLDRAIHHFDSTEYVSLFKKLKQDVSTFFDSAINCVRRTCLCHADVWKENILYKYEDEKPISACLIDYQTARISCSALDTLYLIMTSTSTELRKRSYHQLLDIYYQMFDQILKEAGLNSQEVYSRQMFDYDLKVVTPACVIVANCAFWLSNGLQEEGHVKSKVVWTTTEEKKEALKKYKGIMKAIIDDCCSYGYISLDCD